jgi:hypothetical protein
MRRGIQNAARRYISGATELLRRSAPALQSDRTQAPRGKPLVRVSPLPTAVLAATLSLCAVVSFFSGIILDSIAQTRREMKRLNYLSLPPKS